ncbi:MAG: WS/DGAT domain-containing protein [Tetrasphaera sp.]
MATQIAVSDLTWLLMDRPNNLMQVHGLFSFDELPPLEEIRQAVFDRVVSKYRVMSQIPVNKRGRWYWEDDVDFDIARHVPRIVLEDARPETMRAHVSAQFSRPIDRSRPLWEYQVISGPPEQSTAGVILTRHHHGLADGIRLVQLLMGMCDPREDAMPGKVGRGDTASIADRVLHLAEHTVRDTVDYVQHAGEAVAHHGRAIFATLNPLDFPHQLERVADLARHPVKAIDAVTSVAADDNEFSNSWRELSRLLLHDRADTGGAWSGHPGVAKKVDWLEGLSLADVRAAAKRHGSTINDTLMAAVSLALTDYLDERGVEEITDLGWMMPISLRPIDASLPDQLGNHFAVILFEMPLGIRDPSELIAEIHLRSTRLKNSVEPVVSFGMQRFIAESPLGVARRVTNFFSGKTVGQLSNVPGPRVQLDFVGHPVRSIIGWVPTSGDQPLGICLFSYNGTVAVGIASDARMVPDPEHISELIRRNITRLARG